MFGFRENHVHKLSANNHELVLNLACCPSKTYIGPKHWLKTSLRIFSPNPHSLKLALITSIAIMVFVAVRTHTAKQREDHKGTPLIFRHSVLQRFFYGALWIDRANPRPLLCTPCYQLSVLFKEAILSLVQQSRSLTKLDGDGMEFATETEYRALLYAAWRSQISIFSQFCR